MQKIWIDLDNTPHVPLFAPIIRQLEERGHPVVVTARDAFQVRELADYFGLRYTLIGRHFGKHMSMKLVGLGLRALQLLPTALRESPTLSISHGSRSQLAVSSLLGIRSLMIADYEHATTWAGIRPTWVMVPDVIPYESVRTNRDRVLRYPGIKEDVYVPFFRPDVTTRQRLGLTEQQLVVLIRPPATEAHYRSPASETMFHGLIEHLAAYPDLRMVLLPRNAAQAETIRNGWPELVGTNKIVFPAKVENGLNLIWSSDLVVSGGGTMNREAAALNVPVYSIFRGPLGAVDRSLESQGRLILLTSVEDIRSKLKLTPRKRDANVAGSRSNGTLNAILAHIADLVATTGQSKVRKSGAA